MGKVCLLGVGEMGGGGQVVLTPAGQAALAAVPREPAAHAKPRRQAHG